MEKWLISTGQQATNKNHNVIILSKHPKQYWLMFLSTIWTHTHTYGSKAQHTPWLLSSMLHWLLYYLTMCGSSLPSCLTSVWPALRQPWSCCHDVSPTRDAGGAPEPDLSPGCPCLLPLPAACPSPSEPTAVEIEPATHSLPWLPAGYTSPHQNATAWQTGRHPPPLPQMTNSTGSNLSSASTLPFSTV